MARKRGARGKPAPPRPADAAAPRVGAAEFKGRCLELMDRVRESGVEYIITKHGTAVAKLVPCAPSNRPAGFFGCMRGTLLRYDRPFDPIPGVWTLDRGLNPDGGE